AHRAAVVAVLAADDVRLGQFDVGHRGQDERRSGSQRCFTCRASGIGGRRVGLVSLIGVRGFLGAVGSGGRRAGRGLDRRVVRVLVGLARVGLVAAGIGFIALVGRVVCDPTDVATVVA